MRLQGQFFVIIGFANCNFQKLQSAKQKMHHASKLECIAYRAVLRCPPDKRERARDIRQPDQPRLARPSHLRFMSTGYQLTSPFAAKCHLMVFRPAPLNRLTGGTHPYELWITSTRLCLGTRSVRDAVAERAIALRLVLTDDVIERRVASVLPIARCQQCLRRECHTDVRNPYAKQTGHVWSAAAPDTAFKRHEGVKWKVAEAHT